MRRWNCLLWNASWNVFYFNFYITMAMSLQENNSSKITEMTVAPSPQWMKDASKEIQERYKLEYVDKVYISGIIAKHYRLNNTK